MSNLIFHFFKILGRPSHIQNDYLQFTFFIIKFKTVELICVFFLQPEMNIVDAEHETEITVSTYSVEVKVTRVIQVLMLFL